MQAQSKPKKKKKPKLGLKSMQRKSARKKLLNLKVTEWELAQMKSRAAKYHATLSQWMRDAAMRWTPTRHDLVPLDETDPNSPLTIPEATETPMPADL